PVLEPPIVCLVEQHRPRVFLRQRDARRQRDRQHRSEQRRHDQDDSASPAAHLPASHERGRRTAPHSTHPFACQVTALLPSLPIASRRSSQYATRAINSTPISVNRIRTNGELPSHQRSLVKAGSLPTEYSSPMRKLVTRPDPAIIKSPWIDGLRSRLRNVP